MGTRGCVGTLVESEDGGRRCPPPLNPESEGSGVQEPPEIRGGLGRLVVPLVLENLGPKTILVQMTRTTSE